MKFLQFLVDLRNETSPANKFRRKRFELFLDIIQDIPKPIRILDVGGTQLFWKQMNFNNTEVSIVLLNLELEKIEQQNILAMVGDARSMKQFGDKSFDIVISNSVIEHLANFEDQKKMAKEVERVGKRFFVQTPNKYFPLEPHFLMPYFASYPKRFKIFLLTHFDIGWFKKFSNKREAELFLTNFNLLSLRQMKILFPTALIYKEKFFGLSKSFIAYVK